MTMGNKPIPERTREERREDLSCVDAYMGLPDPLSRIWGTSKKQICGVKDYLPLFLISPRRAPLSAFLQTPDHNCTTRKS